MKAAKWIVLAGGVLAVIGFFLPFITASDHTGSESISAYEMVFAGQDQQMQILAGGTTPDELTAELREVAPIMVGFWTPAILLSIIATIAIIRGRMTNLTAVFGMLTAIANVFAWYVLYEGMNEVNKEEPMMKIVLGLGTHALLAGGLLGFIGSAAVTFRPETAP